MYSNQPFQPWPNASVIDLPHTDDPNILKDQPSWSWVLFLLKNRAVYWCFFGGQPGRKTFEIHEDVIKRRLEKHCAFDNITISILR